MYTRVPSRKPPHNPMQVNKEPPSAIQLPQNYSGNAFTSDGYKRPIAPESTQKPVAAPPKFDSDLRKAGHISPSVTPSIPVSTKGALGYSDYPKNDNPQVDEEEIIVTHEEPAENTEFNNYKKLEDIPEHHNTEIIDTPQRSGTGSLFSSMLQGGMFKDNFPFGHGLGSEELLILGIMLSIYLSGEADGELMMLLGILLFAG